MSKTKILTFLLLGTIGLCGCGKYDSAPAPAGGHMGGTQQALLSANRQTSGVFADGTMTITNTGTLTIPLPSEFPVLANATDFWHVSLCINGCAQSCDYVHNASTGVIVWGAGCTTVQTYFPVNVGDVVTIHIGTNVTSGTALTQVTLTSNY